MNIDEGFLPLVAVEDFGNVLHGSYDTVLGFLNRDGVAIDGILDPEGENSANDYGSCTHLVDFGLPAVETPPDEEAKGWLRWNKAYLFGIYKNYSINSPWYRFGEAGWPYRSPDGTVWHLIAYNKGGLETNKLGVYGKRLVGITNMFAPEKIPENLLLEITLPAGALPYSGNILYTLFAPDGKKAAAHNYRAENVLQYVAEFEVSGGSNTDPPVITGAITLDFDDTLGPKAVSKSVSGAGPRPSFSAYTRISGPDSSLGWFAEEPSVPSHEDKNEWFKFSMIFENVPDGPQGGSLNPGSTLTYVLFVGYDRYGVRQLVELEQITNGEKLEVKNVSLIADPNVPRVPPTFDPAGVPHNPNLPIVGGTFSYDSTVTYFSSQSFLRNGKKVVEIIAKEVREYEGNVLQVYVPPGFQVGVWVNPTSGLTKDSFVAGGTLVSTTFTGNGRDAGGVYVGGSYTTFEYQTCGLNVWCMKRPSSNEVFGWVTPDWQGTIGGIGIGTISVGDVPKIAADPLTGAFLSTTIRYF